MKLSFDWLSDYVDLSGTSAQEVADKLTMGAFEVEEVRRVGPAIEGPLVVGEILAIYPHPNADKIRLTKVQVRAGEEPLEIVCGAQNIEVGQKIPVALPGAKVINRHDGTPLLIKTTSIRGVRSNGMLCSASELGFTTEDIDGILILSDTISPSLDLGTDVQELLQLYPDWVLHVQPRSNRGDALSVKGLAREVAALMKRPLKEPEWCLQAPSDHVAPDTVFDTAIENYSECRFFTIRVIKGLEIKPAPSFMTRRLEAVGVRSINNVVDITNYVMYELGQPLHAYDLSKLKSRALIVRRARPHEKIVTIDGHVRELTEEVLVIADKQQAVAIAGIMGGKESEITDATHDVALEAAWFQPARVRKGSRLLGLSSEGSLRWERGVDLAQVEHASNRATAFIKTYCGGKIGASLGLVGQAGQPDVQPRTISVRLKQLPRLLDVQLSAEQIKDLLSPLGFEVENVSSAQEPDPTVTVEVPSFRQGDVSREIDVIEEICRLWGYDRVPVSMPRSTVAPPLPDDLWGRIRHNLAGQGLNEALIGSLVSTDKVADTAGDKMRGAFGMETPETLIRVLNPLSEDHQVLRQSLLPGLIRALRYNQDRGLQDVWLFELGFVYEKRASFNDNGSIDSTQMVVESPRAAAIIMGEREMSQWAQPNWQDSNINLSPLGFYVAKGIIESLLAELAIKLSDVRFFRTSNHPACLHQARSCQIMALEEGLAASAPILLGWLGQLNPALQDSIELKKPAYLFEIDLNALQKVKGEKVFREMPMTPVVSRDLTVDVAKSIDHDTLASLIRAFAGPNLQELQLASVFELGEEKKSLSYQLIFQHPQETLTKAEVEDALAAIRQGLVHRLSASFRS